MKTHVFVSAWMLVRLSCRRRQQPRAPDQSSRGRPPCQEAAGALAERRCPAWPRAPLLTAAVITMRSWMSVPAWGPWQRHQQQPQLSAGPCRHGVGSSTPQHAAAPASQLVQARGLPPHLRKSGSGWPPPAGWPCKGSAPHPRSSRSQCWGPHPRLATTCSRGAGSAPRADELAEGDGRTCMAGQCMPHWQLWDRAQVRRDGRWERRQPLPSDSAAPAK